MEFRWTAALAVWTILSGPVFSGYGSRPPPLRQPPRVTAAHQPRRDQPSALQPARSVHRPPR